MDREEPLILHEWQPADRALCTDDVATLIGHPERPVDLQPTGKAGEWRVKARAKVGAIRLKDFDIVIRPKAGIENVMYLMGVGRIRDWYGPDAAQLGESEDLFAGVARLFAHAVQMAIGGGLQHDYVTREERLVAMRGRPDITQQLRRPWLPVPAACRYDDYTADIRLNQLLKRALMLVLTIPQLPGQVRRTLLLQLALLEEVTVTDPDLLWADQWAPSRLDQRYERAIRMAAVLLRRLAISDSAGGSAACTFLVDMNDLFERFLEDGLRHRLENLGLDLSVTGQEYGYLDEEEALSAIPDVVVRQGRRPVFVLDAKYVLGGDGGVDVDHYVQVLSYAIMHGIGEVSLVYARDPRLAGAARERTSRIVRVGVHINSWVIDLAVPPSALEAELDRIADRVVARIALAGVVHPAEAVVVI